jgi:hypothetical protein
MPALGDELQGVQLKARLAWHLGIEVPIKVCQCEALIKPALLEAPLGQSGTAPVKFIL